MKTLIAVVVAAFGLAGCVAVPAYDPGYAYSPGYYYAPAPAATFSFGYSHHSHRGHRRSWR